MNFSEVSKQIRQASKSVEPIRTASVGVFSGGRILMGIRRDSGKWTLPGGHLTTLANTH